MDDAPVSRPALTKKPTISETRTVCITREEKDEHGEKRMRIASGNLRRVLLQPEAENKPIAIISIAGASRTGKSFMLNYVLRYLRRKGWENPNWIGGPSTVIEKSNFEWRSGPQRCTTGLRILKEKFQVPMPSGETMIVMIMDTQGLFDHKTPEPMNKSLLTLSTLLSSVQIFNVKGNIDAQHLHYLKTCIDFAMEASKDTEADAYLKLQRLVILIRDCGEDDVENQYSFQHGEECLTRILNSNEGGMEQRNVRQKIKSSFQNVGCFPMPYPGKKVAGTKFQGTNGELDDDFQMALKSFVEDIGNPANLVPKSSTKFTLTGRQILNMIAECDKLFAIRLFEPLKMMTANATAHISAEGEAAFHEYTRMIEERLPEVNLDEKKLKKIDAEVRKHALRRFDLDSSWQSDDYRTTYREHLQRQCNEYFQNLLEQLHATTKGHERVRKATKYYECLMKKRMNNLPWKGTLSEMHKQTRDDTLSKYKKKVLESEFDNAISKKYEEIKRNYEERIERKAKSATLQDQKQEYLRDLVQVRLKQLCLEEWDKELTRYHSATEMEILRDVIRQKVRNQYWSDAISSAENKYRVLLDSKMEFVSNKLMIEAGWIEKQDFDRVEELAKIGEESYLDRVNELTEEYSKKLQLEIKKHRKLDDSWQATEIELRKVARHAYLGRYSEILVALFKELDEILVTCYNSAIERNEVLWGTLKREIETHAKTIVLGFERDLLGTMSDRHISKTELENSYKTEKKVMERSLPKDLLDTNSSRDGLAFFQDILNREMKDSLRTMSRKNEANKKLRSIQECGRPQRKRDKFKKLFGIYERS